MKIKKTTFNEIEYLNQLITRSKSFWNYDQEYLNAAIALIQITEAWLHTHEGFTLSDNGKIIGFLGIEIFDIFWKLEHLWIDPDKIRQGFGKKAIQYLCTLAREKNMTKILLLPDPPAEIFYSHLGAQFTGVRVPSRVPNGPDFQEMVFYV